MNRPDLVMVLMIFVVAVLATVPGCVVWDIKDGIVASNEHLDRINMQLDEIDQNLDLANTNLERVQSRLDPIDGTLASMDTQLANLQTQLDATNAHLESLRKTINNIDSTIPFLKLSGDDEEEQESLEHDEQDRPVQGEDQPAAEVESKDGGS